MDDDLACMGLFARFADVVARLSRGDEGNAAARLAVARNDADDLVLHHCIRGVGNRRARHDAHALARLDRPVVHLACTNLGNDVEFHRLVLARTLELCRMHRKAVHRRMREGRDVDVARQIGGRHTAHRVENLDHLRRKRRHVRENERLRLFQRNHLCHRIPFHRKTRRRESDGAHTFDGTYYSGSTRKATERFLLTLAAP